MDTRWTATPHDYRPEAHIYWQPTSSIEDVQNGTTQGAIDISPWVSNARQGSSEFQATLDWNNEFFGTAQPAPGQVINLVEDGLVLWVGIIDSITGYTVSFGVRRFTITARSRETQDIWKSTKYVTPAYPLGTALSLVISDIAQMVGMSQSEVLVPVGSYSTSHSSTQLANVSAWEMLNTLFLPMGQEPVIDCLGRLRGVSKDVMGRTPDIILGEDSVLKVDGVRMRPPTTRYILNWLDPHLTKVLRQGQLLGTATMTAGFFTPVLWKYVPFSPDKTQRAEGTYLRVRTSVNQFRIGGTVFVPCFYEFWDQTTDVEGRIMIVTLGWDYVVLLSAFTIKVVASLIPDGVVTGGLFVAGGITIPIGRPIEAAADIAIWVLTASMGTGDYEIWGQPFDVVHARNSSEAYDSSAAQWLDNPVTVECDFIANEAHAQAVCTRELVYKAKAANSWSVTIWDDRRVEKGDLLQLPDGSILYVTDFSRSIMRGEPSQLDVQGFLVGSAVTNG